ncbi:MAG: hypothetical protein NT062_11865, partial [Proteobacteria bacterium]|nr:hypothetical protein [Pseudomonadota bacterium]
WAPVTMPPETRERLDSLVARGKSQKITITLPRGFAAGTATTYPLVVDLDRSPTVDDAAFVVHRTADVTGKWLVATGDEIATFMTAKYPIDPTHVRVTDDPALGRHSTVRVAAGPTRTPRTVVVATKPVTRKAPESRAVVARAQPDGLRWVRHPHHHELDYQVDAAGSRVKSPHR